MKSLERSYINKRDAEYYRTRVRVERETKRLLAEASGAPKRDPFAGIDTIPQMPDPLPWADGQRAARLEQKTLEEPTAPEGAARVVFVINDSLPANVYGQAVRDGAVVRVDLTSEVIAGLTTNDLEAWKTLLHELGHVVFGDIDRAHMTDHELAACERRAEAFAVVVLAAINDVLTKSVALHAGRQSPPRRFRVVPQVGKAFASFEAVGGAA